MPTPDAVSDISDSDLRNLCAIHRKTGGRDFPPTQPNHPFVLRMLAAGLMVRRDGRCMFERHKDEFLAFTEAGHKAVAAAPHPEADAGTKESASPAP